MAGARRFRRWVQPGPLVGSIAAGSCVNRGRTLTTTRAPLWISSALTLLGSRSDRDSESGEPVGHPSHVVGVVGADAQLDQPAGGALDDVKLFAPVAGRKARTVPGQAEFGVVATGVFDVGNADR